MQPLPAGRSTLHVLRLVALSAVAAMTGVFILLAVLGLSFTAADTTGIALPVLLGVADLILVPAVGSTVRPLPHGIAEPDARRIANGVLRTVTLLRLALAAAPAVFGLVASVTSASLLPFAIGCAFAVPLVLFAVLPREPVVDAIRQRLESGGTPSHLGDELGTPRP